MKKILLSILVSIIGLISFGYCLDGVVVTNNVEVVYKKYTPVYFVPGDCFVDINSSTLFRGNSNSQIRDINNNVLGTMNQVGLEQFGSVCFSFTGNLYFNYNTTNSISLYKTHYDLSNVSCDCPTCPTCPTCEEQYTSLECQQQYSLMPISSCNLEYCVMNNLCPAGSGGSGSGDLQWSSLFINGIQHVGGSIIDVTIPSEIQRDYLYTGVNSDVFKLTVDGLNGDPDYIQGIIDVNSYRPTSEDFTQTFVGGLTLIFPYIIITAVILFIWRFIRKIFK